MRCKKIREIIITDYLDDQISGKGKAVIEKHMEECSDCKNFSVAVRKGWNELFINAKKVYPPEFVWRRVKAEILSGRHTEIHNTTGLITNLIRTIYASGRAIAVAGALALLILIGTISGLYMNAQESLKKDAQIQIQYLDYPEEPLAGIPLSGEKGFGTPIEEYFL